MRNLVGRTYVYVAILLISSIIFSCKKADENKVENQNPTGTTGPTGTARTTGPTLTTGPNGTIASPPPFYKLPRQTIWRDDFNSPGSWKFYDHGGSSDPCNKLWGAISDTSVGDIKSGKLRLITNKLDLSGLNYGATVFAENDLNSISFGKDTFCLEIGFDQFFFDVNSHVIDEQDIWELHMDGIKYSFTGPYHITLDFDTLHMLIYDDTIRQYNCSIRKNDICYSFRGMTTGDQTVGVKSEPTSSTNKILFYNSYFSYQGQCENDTLIVDYIELYKLK